MPEATTTTLPAEPHQPGAIGRRFFELLVAGRLLRSRRSAHLSLVTGLSVAGIALGVAALIVVLAVNTGFQTAFQDKILASYPHLVVMQRGIDLRDWRAVAAKLRAVPEVRYAGPATYDDMMLSAAQGRAGAIVRGVQAQTLLALPPGAIIAGKLQATGELPTWHQSGREITVTAAVAGARHVIVAFGDHGVALPVLATGSPLGGLLVFDAAQCGGNSASAGEPVWLKSPDLNEPMRTAPRQACELVGSWEALAGTYTVRWQDKGIQRDASVHLSAGKTATLVLHGDHATFVAAPPDDIAAASAAVAVVAANGSPVHVAGAADGQPWTARAGELPTMAIGEGLAKRLRVGIGDEVRAVSPLRGMDRLAEGSDSSASGRFRIAAIIRTGFYDHDQRLALVDFSAAQRFLGRGDIARWVEARVEDPILAAQHIDRYTAALQPAEFSELLQAARTLYDNLQVKPVSDGGPRPPTNAVAAVDSWAAAVRTSRQNRLRPQGLYRMLDWEEMNRNIFDAARMQKVAMSLFPFIIVLVAALNVVGTQAVVVHERAREIAILRAMGATRRSVATVFLVQGLFVGLTGTSLGLLTGGLACWLLDAVGYPLDPQVYLISRLPVQTEPMAYFLAGGAAIALAFGAAWLSAQRAAARQPVEALRRLD